MDKLTVKNALTKVGITGEKQNEFFAAFKGRAVESIDDSEITNVLEKLGVTGGQALLDFYAAVKEPQILDQELDLDELEAVAGGEVCDDDDADKDHCTQQLKRKLFEDGCAATVEYYYKEKVYNNGNGEYYIRSTCSTNDGCWGNAVQYYKSNGIQIKN